MTEYDGFRVEHEGAVATITLDVPGKLNRVSMLARDQLAASSRSSTADDAVRFVVLTGAGGRSPRAATSPGFLERSPWDVSQLAENVAAPERCSKPVVARLEGYVFGVGLELALACDFRLAARRRPARTARGDDRDDPRLGRYAAARAAGRTRPREGHRHARPPGRQPTRRSPLGLVTEVVRRRPRRRGRVAHRRALAPLAARARDGEARAEHAPTTARSTSGSSSKVSPTASSGRRAIFARASRRSGRSGSPSSPVSNAVDTPDLALRNLAYGSSSSVDARRAPRRLLSAPACPKTTSSRAGGGCTRARARARSRDA